MSNFIDSFNCDLYDIYNDEIKNDFTGKPEYLPEEKRWGAPIWTYPYMFKRMDNFGDRKETLGQRLVRWCIRNNCTRERNGVKYVDVTRLHEYINAYAARWGYSFAPMTIRSYLHHKYSPKIDRATMIANALNVPVAWLMGYGPNDPDQIYNPLAVEAFRVRREAIRAARATNMAKARTAKRKKVAAA